MLNDYHMYYVPNLHNFHMEIVQTLLSMQNMWNAITFGACGEFVFKMGCKFIFPIFFEEVLYAIMWLKLSKG